MIDIIDAWIFFFSGNKICNNLYLSIIKKKIFFIKGIIVFPVYRILKFLSKYINFFNKFLLGQEKKIDDLLNKNIVFKKENKFTDVPEYVLNEGNDFLKKFNIHSNDKIVLLYVRDSKYLTEKFKDKDYSYHNFRDCNIENFDLALDELTSRGYYVFRVGNNIKNSIFST